MKSNDLNHKNILNLPQKEKNSNHKIIFFMISCFVNTNNYYKIEKKILPLISITKKKVIFLIY